MRSTRLSVTLVNYNHGKYIRRALEAILTQSRQPDEFVIIDDGSTDDSVDVIRSYTALVPKIRFIGVQKNQGGIRSALHAFGLCTGEYYYAASADDYVVPGFFEKAMNIAVRYPQAGIVFGEMMTVDEWGNKIRVDGVRHWCEPLFASPEEYRRDVIDGEHPMLSLSSSTIYRRTALVDVGVFRQELGAWSDTFALRAVALKHGACYLPQPCAAWRVSPNGFSGALRQDPVHLLDIMARAAWLMRSPEFRDRFPEPCVREWELRFRREVVTDYGRRLRDSWGRHLDLCGRGGAINGRSAVRYVVGRKLMSLGTRICSHYATQKLAHYPGDVSCYKARPQT